MVRPVAGDLPEQVKNNQSVNMAAGNGGQKMSQYPWFTVYFYILLYLHYIRKKVKRSDSYRQLVSTLDASCLR